MCGRFSNFDPCTSPDIVGCRIGGGGGESEDLQFPPACSVRMVGVVGVLLSFFWPGHAVLVRMGYYTSHGHVYAIAPYSLSRAETAVIDSF